LIAKTQAMQKDAKKDPDVVAAKIDAEVTRLKILA
jgi:hypothetical protein